MKEAIEISTGKHLETMEEINESNSALECPICHLPLTRVHDLDSVGHLAHPPYSRLYMPELCPNMDPNFSKGASSSYGTISYNWNLKHVLKQLELNSKGESILKAVFDSIAHERQNYIALTAKAAHTIKEAEERAIGIVQGAEDRAGEIEEKARLKGETKGEAKAKEKIKEAEEGADHWFNLFKQEKEKSKKSNREVELDMESVLLLHLQQDREKFELEKKEWREKHESGSI